jgi:hypothetical protein
MAALVEPTDDDLDTLSILAADLDEAIVERNRAFRRTLAPPSTAATAPGPSPERMAQMLAAELARTTAQEVTALEQVSQWMDEKPNVRMDNSGDNFGGPYVEQLAASVAISRNPASIPVYRKMIKHQPDLLTIRFPDTEATLEERMKQEVEAIKREHDVGGLAVVQEKLNPGGAQMVKMDRLLGTLDNERKTNPFPRGLQALIREQLTGIPIDKQKARVTKKGGRRRKMRNRKTKRAVRKTK